MPSPQPLPGKTVGVQFTKDGPPLPFKLLQALEDGAVVIFCGAGVSRRCGLPDFRTLVTDIAVRLGRPMDPDEEELFNSNAYDAALGLIENRIGKQRLRQAVKEILDIKPGADLATHEALLQLATSRQGHLRLVTTNFDRGFELAPCTLAPTFDYAPYLPLPGSSWNSVVHLHGGLGNQNDTGWQNLIFTSADFGRAYLTEGWAARFVAELFRRSAAILFVGYSVADPAIRYIVDAFAADQANEGAHTAKAYVLIGSTAEHAARDQRTWRSRGIEPLTYDARENHRLLHETLRSCANRYRMGYFDRARIIGEFGPQIPSAPLDAAAVSQITWALQDATGHAARRFATLDPSPPIEWLDVLASEGLLSLAAFQHAVPAVAWLAASSGTVPLHPVTEGLCRWLVTKLSEPQLLHWVIKQGSHLHPDLAQLTRERLADTESAPLPKGVNAIWQFLSAPIAQVHARHVSHDLSLHYPVLETHAWDLLIRDRVRLWLAPTIRFKEPFPRGAEHFDPDDLGSYATVEFVPAAGEGSWEIRRLLSRTDAGRIAYDLLGELTDLLHRGLTYLEFFGRANSENDGTYFIRPSIDDHGQNNELYDWTLYIQLLREAWELVARADRARARVEVSKWMHLGYPLLRRFVLWSCGKSGGLSATESVEYLRAQSASALWGLDTHHELLQYLRRIAPLLSTIDAESLFDLIVTGPPRAQFRANLGPDKIREFTDRAIRLRLLKLREYGAPLPVRSEEPLHEIMQRHPEWPKTTTERDEFLNWSGETEVIGPYHFEQRLNDYVDWTVEHVRAELEATPTDPDTMKRWRGLLLANIHRALGVLELLGESYAFDAGVWGLGLDHFAGEQTKADCIRLYAKYGAHLGPAFLSQHLQSKRQRKPPVPGVNLVVK